MSKGLELKYFVLKPNGDNAYAEASRAALKKYAIKIRPTNVDLANDIESWLSALKGKEIQ